MTVVSAGFSVVLPYMLKRLGIKLVWSCSMFTMGVALTLMPLVKDPTLALCLFASIGFNFAVQYNIIAAQVKSYFALGNDVTSSTS